MNVLLKSWNWLKKVINLSLKFLKQRPFTTFLIALSLTLGLIILSTGVFSPTVEPTIAEISKVNVNVLDLTDKPTLNFNAKIKKEGVINIYAQTNGVVNHVYKYDGQSISKNTSILYLSSNYNGGNSASISKQISLTTLNNTKNTYNDQTNLINKNKNLINDKDDLNDKLNDINSDSKDRTKDLINLNEGILDTINDQIKALEDADATDEDTLALRQQKSQVESAISGLKSSADNLKITNSDDQDDINDLQKEISLKQLDLEKKALDLSLKTAELQYKLASITESFYYPASPFTGVVEKIHVKIGEIVNPGDLLATVSSNNKKASGDILISKTIAQKIDKDAVHTVLIDGTSHDIKLSYVTSEAVSSSLLNASFIIPTDQVDKIIDKENLVVNVKLKTGIDNINPIIPIESIYQSHSNDYVLIVSERDNNLVAESRVVEIGSNLDGFVEIKSGLLNTDKVITSRNAISGDLIQVN